MQRISVQLPHDVLQLLKRRAGQNGISVSRLANGFIAQGLQQAFLQAENKSTAPKSIDRYLLKSVFETLLIVRTLVELSDAQVLTDASQKARELAAQALEEIT